MAATVPQLLIIAGPNGAGKSTYSKDLSPTGAFIYDADLLKAEFEARFPDLPAESIYYAIQNAFLDHVDIAIRRRSDLVIETNFRDPELMNIVAQFKDNGYMTTMIYLGLKSIGQSADRVAHRVAHGGHDVDMDSIRYNYEEGLKNLAYFAERFDAVRVMEASGDYFQLITLYQADDGRMVYLSNSLPAWSKETLNYMKGRLDGEEPDRSQDQGPRRSPRR